MTTDELALLRIVFSLRILSLDGQAYEDFFCSVMEASDRRFKRVKPQGSIGDRKNDGYIQEDGRYYQVFAPENPRTATAAAVKKAETDFAGLLAFWESISPIKEYWFAFNDKYQGTSPTIEQTLAALKARHKLDASDVFLPRHLEDFFFDRVSDDLKIRLLGRPPNPADFADLNYSVVGQVLDSVHRALVPVVITQLGPAPDFERKLVANDFSSSGATLLRTGSYQVGALEQYFARNSKFARRETQQALTLSYAECRKQVMLTPTGARLGDLILMAMQSRIFSNPTAAQQTAIFVLLAFFFETCDIFEEPT